MEREVGEREVGEREVGEREMGKLEMWIVRVSAAHNTRWRIIPEDAPPMLAQFD
jgi:hypothetical protein